MLQFACSSGREGSKDRSGGICRHEGPTAGPRGDRQEAQGGQTNWNILPSEINPLIRKLDVKENQSIPNQIHFKIYLEAH